MTDYVNLLGIDAVQSAAREMRSAAREMEQAARNIEGSFERHQRLLDDWLVRLEQVLENIRSTKP